MLDISVSPKNKVMGLLSWSFPFDHKCINCLLFYVELICADILVGLTIFIYLLLFFAEQENSMVALIPLSDKRLKPRRT